MKRTNLPILNTRILSIESDTEEVRIVLADGRNVRLYHCQDCCESVEIAQIDGDLQRLVGHELQAAYMTYEEKDPAGMDWCDRLDVCLAHNFLHLRSHAGDVCVRWDGWQSGYYSDSITFDDGERRLDSSWDGVDTTTENP